ncbi:hypothetical protein [Paenibacillus sedimenti]|uniref:Extracellular solute-binding protein n=1 Tax=Paenibacillus sedimenti TaxID=2770274 RepID=A0A926QN84_9BACL|nr:hypothetical protein [Paenibacillus sedimenti]MBD0384507.1 hypothetical protein [Paenibacillus sedimenti]
MSFLKIWEAPEGAVGRDDFKVSVRIPGESWQPLFVYEAKVDMHNVRQASMVSSDPEAAALMKLQIDTFNRYKQEDTPMPVNFDFNAIVTPAKNKFTALDPDIQNDIVKVILGKGDPIAQWKEIVKGYDAKGVPEAIKEVNEEAAKRGIK